MYHAINARVAITKYETMITKSRLTNGRGLVTDPDWGEIQAANTAINTLHGGKI